MSECSICFDNITAETGRTILSCGHEFHLNCVVKWFVNQDASAPSTCALCRKSMGPTEDLPHEEEPEEEEDEDDDSDSDYEEEDTEENLRRAKELGDTFKAMDPEEAKVFAATKIQALARGYFVRLMAADLKDIHDDMKDAEESLARMKMIHAVQLKAVQLGRIPWKKQVASKIQALWRGHFARKLLVRKMIGLNQA